MPDQNGNSLRLWAKVAVASPTEEHRGYKGERGTIIRIIPGWDAEIKFDDPAVENHIFEGRELLLG